MENKEVPRPTGKEDDENDIRRVLSLSRQATPELLSSSPPYSKITKLDMADCGLSELPCGFETAFPNLSVLFLSKNKFREIPAVIGKCLQLQMVAFKDNGLQSIHPDALQPQLRWLILTNNQLKSLPDAIGERCHKLQKCMLSGNQLQKIPDAMKQCRNLELIRLASNQLDEEPTILLQHCPKLAWIALSDNPCMNKRTYDSQIAPLKGIDLDISDNDEILGRGAGGVTRKVHWKGHGRYVAVKEYSGTMTSDGLPETERRLACAAGALNTHALVQVLGETKTNGALVMEYLNGFIPLAGPPSMESCSRDVYDDDENSSSRTAATTMVMSVDQVETLVSELLQALTALHAAGICHGDFYGHNILVDSTNPANVRLTDLGAAFFYDKALPSAPYMELTEIRAFATLCQEVLQHFVLKRRPNSQQHNNPKLLLEELVEYLEEATAIAIENTTTNDDTTDGEQTANFVTFEKILVWWKQKQLTVMAKSFEPDECKD